MNQSTIAAISTPIGNGGISIIKISGKKAFEIAGKLFTPSRNPKNNNNKSSRLFLNNIKSHLLYHGFIKDPNGGKIIDEVLTSFMKGPHSYTGEDIVEINSHSGNILLQVVMNMILDGGAKLAKPGEFTKRAFLNGRIDLTQAEAVIDIINSKTISAVHMAASQMKGGFSREIKSIQRVLEKLLIKVDAYIDFSEDTIEKIVSQKNLIELNRKVIDRLRKLSEDYGEHKIYREGMAVAIVGKPNVGKSSLLNRLVGNERAIVTDIPGTTRDTIKESFIINGISIDIIDTAGVQKTNNEVEVLGIEKTMNTIEAADLLLFILEYNRKTNREDLEIYKRIKNKPKIIIVNKIDKGIENKGVETPETWKEKKIYTSALYNKGIKKIKKEILSVIGKKGLDPEQCGLIGNIRQKRAVDQCLDAAMRVRQGIEAEVSPEILAIDIQEAMDALGSVVGVITKSDVIDRIFEKFCIGK